MVLKTFYNRIRKSIPRIRTSKKHSTLSTTEGKKQPRHAKKQQDNIRDDPPPSQPKNKSPEEELREEYQELIRTSYRMVRCLGDDLESSFGSSYVSGYRYREQTEEDILKKTWSDHSKVIPRTSNFAAQKPIEVTHLLDDSDDESFGLHFANMAATVEEEEAKDDAESRESVSVFINIDDCRDTDSLRLGASSKRDEDQDIYYRTSNRGYF
ncbi:unnamed protein product [Cylindrotheca closterium]|uniref:Uncharacterized protein n=1 Tax=Cylindrotheca closterium TaxID=2856 RepID=A0AAD2GAN0_9STRA|nr:unnamed protein product [Cylindrotheca closterium]